MIQKAEIIPFFADKLCCQHLDLLSAICQQEHLVFIIVIIFADMKTIKYGFLRKNEKSRKLIKYQS